MAQQFTARKFGNSKASSSIAIDTRELQNLGKALKKVDKEKKNTVKVKSI